MARLLRARQWGAFAGVQKELNRVTRKLRRDDELSRPALNGLTAKSYIYFWRAEFAAFNQKVAE